MADPIRLQKYFTDCGVLSRRAAEKEIAAGLVTVNGQIAHIGDSVIPGEDVVLYKGRKLLPPKSEKRRYILLNKPRGFVTTMSDEKGRPTVSDLLKGVGTRVYPVGRLDMDSDGMLILTDDGGFAAKMMHPRFHVAKTYLVFLSEKPEKEQIQQLRNPMVLDGYPIKPVEVRLLPPQTLEMTLHEGRNRQIRKMCEQVGFKITRLQRVSIGNISLGDLPIGKWRELTEHEVTILTSQEKGS